MVQVLVLVVLGAMRCSLVARCSSRASQKIQTLVKLGSGDHCTVPAGTSFIDFAIFVVLLFC